MELVIDRGVKSYDVKDIDGTLLGVIKINPADIGISGRFVSARNAIAELAEQAKKTFLLFLPRQLKIDIRECHCHGEKPRFYLTDAAFVHTLILQTVRSLLRRTALLNAAGALRGIHFGLFCGSAQLL